MLEPETAHVVYQQGFVPAMPALEGQMEAFGGSKCYVPSAMFQVLCSKCCASSCFGGLAAEYFLFGPVQPKESTI